MERPEFLQNLGQKWSDSRVRNWGTPRQTKAVPGAENPADIRTDGVIYFQRGLFGRQKMRWDLHLPHGANPGGEFKMVIRTPRGTNLGNKDFQRLIAELLVNFVTANPGFKLIRYPGIERNVDVKLSIEGGIGGFQFQVRGRNLLIFAHIANPYTQPEQDEDEGTTPLDSASIQDDRVSTAVERGVYPLKRVLETTLQTVAGQGIANAAAIENLGQDRDARDQQMLQVLENIREAIATQGLSPIERLTRQVGGFTSLRNRQITEQHLREIQTLFAQVPKPANSGQLENLIKLTQQILIQIPDRFPDYNKTFDNWLQALMRMRK